MISRYPSSLSRVIFVVHLLVAILLTGCVTARNFRDPKERIARRTAYTLTSGEMRAGVELLGQLSEDLGVKMGFAAGFGKHAEAGINVAHLAMGLVNVHGKYNFIDRKWWALGARLGFLWIHPPSIWALPDKYRDVLGDINIISIPLDIIASFPVADWVSLNLGAGYVHSELFGDVSEDTIVMGGDIGTRQIHLDPQFLFYAADKICLFAGARILVWGILMETVSAEAEIAEGFVAGVRSNGWKRLDFAARTFGIFGGEVRFGRTTHVRVYAVVNGAFSRIDLIKSPVLPGLAVFWRF